MEPLKYAEWSNERLADEVYTQGWRASSSDEATREIARYLLNQLHFELSYREEQYLKTHEPEMVYGITG